MKKSKVISLAVLAVVFALVCYLGFSGVISDFEVWLPKAINPEGKIGEFFYSVTVLGDTTLDVLFLATLMLLPMTRKKIGIPVVSTTISSTLINRTIKNIVARPRPEIRLVEAGGFSFPSGHAMNNMALYLMLFFCILPYCKTRLQKAISFCVLMFFPISMGISRVYFNVHYFSDVVCGWCLGAIVAICFSMIFKKVINKNA